MFQIGEGLVWEKARKMQQKMSKTRSHVESRIIEITNILAPPISQEERKSGGNETPAQSNEAATKEEESNSDVTCPPGYEAATCQETPSAPPSYTETGNQKPSALLYFMQCKTLFFTLNYWTIYAHKKNSSNMQQ